MENCNCSQSIFTNCTNTDPDCTTTSVSPCISMGCIVTDCEDTSSNSIDLKTKINGTCDTDVVITLYNYDAERLSYVDIDVDGVLFWSRNETYVLQEGDTRFTTIYIKVSCGILSFIAEALICLNIEYADVQVV